VLFPLFPIPWINDCAKLPITRVHPSRAELIPNDPSAPK
jgi:hypothetical protein